MGAVCAGGIKKDANLNPAQVKISRFSGKLAKKHNSLPKELPNSTSIANGGKMKKKSKKPTTMQPEKHYSGELLLSVSRELKPSKPPGEGAPAKVTHKTSFLGKAGTMGLEKTLEVLDTLGSSMSNLNARSGFISGMPSRGNRISILAFEVANTISKGANLFQSLSEENVNFLKEEILHSEGVRQLVSTDMKELLAIAASDKRLDAELSTDRQSREEAGMTVHELTTLVQHTSIMEKLVDIVTYLHQAILEAFGSSGVTVAVDEAANHQRLGKAGLALHYANMITQIDNIASRPTSLPPNTRDSLYRGLPPSVKTSLRSRLQMFEDNEELTITQVKAEMEKTLQWLVPVAANTTKAHQGFGWVGEWASNNGSEYGKSKTGGEGNLIRVQTLYHADKEKTDKYILETVAWLHRLINLVRQRDNGMRTGGGLAVKSGTYRGEDLHSKMQQQEKADMVERLSEEERELLNKVNRRRMIPGISKSQELIKRRRYRGSLSRNKSTGTSPAKEMGTRRKMIHQPRGNLLDILDGLHSML
ncbi:Protein PSK SIMULATOR 2 [Linum grandiflorum]